MIVKVSERDLMSIAVGVRLGKAGAARGSLRVAVLLDLLVRRGSARRIASGWELTAQGDAELDRYIAAAAPKASR